VKKPGPGMIASGVAHAALLIYAAVGFTSAKAYDPHQEALPVEVVTLSEFDQLTKGHQLAKEKAETPKVEAKKIAAVDTKPPPPSPEAKEDVMAPPPAPEPEVEVPPPEPKPPEKAEAPPPEPTPAPEPKPQDLPKPEKKVEKKPPEKPPEKKAEKKPEKPKVKFDPSKIASLVDKRDPGHKAAEARVASNVTTAGTASGTASQLSLSQDSMIGKMIQDQLYACWTPPIGTQQSPDLLASIEFNVTEQGILVGTPVLKNSSPNPLFTSFAESAMRAVQACTQPTRPLKLPIEHYNKWQLITLDFIIPPV
jgi:outer membrane biosynthesis protein TonB